MTNCAARYASGDRPQGTAVPAFGAKPQYAPATPENFSCLRG